MKVDLYENVKVDLYENVKVDLYENVKVDLYENVMVTKIKMWMLGVLLQHNFKNLTST